MEKLKSTYKILNAVYDANGSLEAYAPSNEAELFNAVFEDDGSGKGRLRIALSTTGGTSTDHFVTGQTLNNTTLETTLNNGTQLDTDLSSLSANTESQIDFMVPAETGTTYYTVANNFYAAEIDSVALFTDVGTANFTLKNNGTVVGGLDSKAMTTTKAITSLTSGGTFAVGNSLTFEIDTISSATTIYGSIKLN